MNRVGATSANLCRLSRWRAALACIAAGLASTTCRAADFGAWPPPGVLLSVAAGLVTLSLVVLVIGALFAVRSSRTQRRLREEARDARARLLALNDLLEVGRWQTDASHRLQLLQPPRGAAAGRWPALPSAGAPDVPLWERLEAVGPASLRSLLERGASLDDIEVQLDAAPACSFPALLSGRVCTDAAGHFAGYLGTLREMPAASHPRAHAVAPEAGAASTPAAASEAASEADTDASTRPAAAPTDAWAAGSTDAEHESFSFTVSHDLRAPIRVVEGFTKIVKEDYGRLLDRVGNDHLDRVLGAAARMNNMIDALLALSKLSSQPLAQQPVNLSQLASFVVDDLRRQWPEREVVVDIASGLQVQGDPTLLRVVIENLIGNAWKYTSKAAAPRIVFSRHAEHPATTFSVSDNGAGFDMRFADRLFGVFQRLHSANDFPGTGVGLASVRRIVRRHGGDIWGEGEVMQGASFHFSLPISSALGGLAPASRY